MTTELATFVFRLLKVVADRDDRNAIWWRCDGECAPITFFVGCNDFFWWACADAVEVTPENIDVLEQAYADCEAAGDKYETWGALLFCARVRRMRPQGACYPKDVPAIAALLDACGPKRDVDFGNPHRHPEDGGGYAYSASACELVKAVDAVDPQASE